MGREILFRGKQVDTGEWLYGFLSQSRNIKEKPAILKPCINYEENGVMMFGIVDPKTVGQFTGLRDKNGTRIFEGDIVSDVNCEYDKYVVKFSDERCGFFPFAKGDGCGCCEINVLSVKFAEVIGNIHDNPELLK